jgi:hypothetical protein
MEYSISIILLAIQWNPRWDGNVLFSLVTFQVTFKVYQTVQNTMNLDEWLDRLDVRMGR